MGSNFAILVFSQLYIPPHHIRTTDVYTQQVGVTHYFKMDKARRVLGYEVIVPHPVGMERTAARWAEWHRKQSAKGGPSSSLASGVAKAAVVLLALAVVAVMVLVAHFSMHLLDLIQPSLAAAPLNGDW